MALRFENTLINRITNSNCMIQRSELNLKSLVWGKVGSFPWWPGKIIQQIEQKSAPVYKVSFFGDNSYSYLHSENIVLFEHYDFDFNSPFPHDFKLQEAVRLAKAVNTRKKLSSKSTDDDLGTPCEPVTCPAEHSEQVVACQVGEQEKTRLSEHHQSPVENQADLLNIQITNSNFLELIEFSHTLKRNSYCYSKRKEAMLFKSNLKQFLLRKYNLQTNSPPNTTHHHHQRNSNKEHTKLISKIKRKKAIKLNYESISVKATKRLQKLILRHGCSLTYSKDASRELYNLLKGKYELIPKRFELHYIALLREINSKQFENIEETVSNCLEKLRTIEPQTTV